MSVLPVTGADSLRAVKLALLATAIGALLVLVARRRLFGRSTS
jgi:hypothetical protein